MAFKSLFEIKKTGTIFNLSNVSGAFVETGVYNSSEEGVINLELLINSLITAAHFVPKKQESNLNPLLENPVSNIQVKEKGIIEDFHYKDFIQNNVALDTSHFSNQDRSSTYVSPQILTGPSYIKPTFDVIMSRRIQGDISVFPKSYINVDLKNEFVKYKMYFFYTEEGKAESGGDLKVARDLGNIKLLTDSPDANDKSNVVAMLMTTENFFGFINLMAKLKTKSESEAEKFRVEYRMSISASLKAIYLDKKLNSDSVDINQLETFYDIIPYGCLGAFEINLLTRDLFKLLVYDALSLFYDTSSAMLKIITGFNDLQLLYNYLTVHPDVIIQYYNFISGNDKRNEFCSFFTSLSYAYQPVEDPLELPVILMEGDFNVTIVEKNGFLEIHNFSTETEYKQTATSQITPGKEGDPVYVETRNDTTHLKATFHPLDLVILKNAITGDVTVVCALHVKRLVDEENWANILSLVFFVVDILSIFFAVGLLAKSVSGILRVFGIADIVIASVNIAIQVPALREYLKKTESGRWFLDNWNTISMVSAIGIMSVSFARTLLKKSDGMLKSLSTAKNDLPEFTKEIDELTDTVNQLKKLADEVLEAGAAGDPTKSFFALAKMDLEDYIPTGNLIGQTTDYTCAAGSLNMYLNDIGKELSEGYIAGALKTVTRGPNRGANILDIPEALHSLRLDDIKTIAQGSSIQLPDLISNFKSGDKAIVSVWTEELGAHAVLVDKIENGKVFIRDPYPLNIGSSYSVTIDDFTKVFNDKFVVLKK